MDYLESLRYLYSLADFERTGRFADRKDVAPMLALLAELGNPHLGRADGAHRRQQGQRQRRGDDRVDPARCRPATGLFTSPHLHRFTERIQVDGVPVSNEELAAGVEVVAAAVEARHRRSMPDRQLVTFDVLTALGFLLFREHDVQAQVIEVGLGGLLDSTNVFETKDCTVITNIGLEHREILGDTVAEIARAEGRASSSPAARRSWRRSASRRPT